MSIAARLTDDLAPIMSPDLATYIDAFAQMFAEVELYATDQGDEWDREAYSIMLDVDRCPAKALPYLAQFVGAELPVGTDEAGARAYIRAHNRFNRGTPAAIRDAAKATLTGTQYCNLLERDGGAYKLTVITRTAETPNPSLTLAAMVAVKPAGITITHATVSGETWNEATHTWSNVSGTASWDSTDSTAV